ncbi:hypothetical protein OSTOST_21090, partial [Ostertagia ostertagi]
MLAKSTREQRGIIRRLFACHAGMGTATNTNFMRSIRRKVRRSFNLGRRRPSLVAPPVTEAPTSAFTTNVPVITTHISGQAPCGGTLSSGRSTVPGYPAIDKMPRPTPSNLPYPAVPKSFRGATVNGPRTPALSNDVTVAVPSSPRRSSSDPEI